MKFPQNIQICWGKWKVVSAGLWSKKIIDARGINWQEKERKKW